jgi:hypothetical protein
MGPPVLQGRAARRMKRVATGQELPGKASEKAHSSIDHLLYPIRNMSEVSNFHISDVDACVSIFRHNGGIYNLFIM